MVYTVTSYVSARRVIPRHMTVIPEARARWSRQVSIVDPLSFIQPRGQIG